MSAETLFAALAARAPSAAVLRNGLEVWTAGELLAEVALVADRLADCRVIALLADNSPDWALTDLAALRAGTVALPLPGFFSDDQLRHALNQSGADAIVTDQPERIAALDIGFAEVEKRRAMTWMRRSVAAVSLPAGTAKISYTSGSTGTPKGVCLATDGLIATAQALRERLAGVRIDRHLAVLPLALLLENSAGIYAPILRAAEIDLPPLASLGWQGMAGFAPAALQAQIEATRPNSLILVPELLKAWTLFLSASALRAPAGLEYVAVGGSRVAHEALIAARRLGIPAYQGYGLTECGSVVSVNCPGDDQADVGRPLAHAQVAVKDDEIHVTTRAFLGYLGDEKMAAGKAFATGDLGHLNDTGHLTLSGRRKSLLITSFGRNIAPEWVESVLLAEPQIAQALVAGDGRQVLCALIVPMRGATSADLAQALTRANARLPDYARVGPWLAAQPFTVANGQATGNGRPQRASILNAYASDLAALYQEETACPSMNS